MGGCQNVDPFFGYPKYEVPYYDRDPKRDHNFDNHPDTSMMRKVVGLAHTQLNTLLLSAYSNVPGRWPGRHTLLETVIVD